MKEFTNPSYTDTTLAEADFHLDGLAFKLAAIRQHKKEDDPVYKMVLAIDTVYGHHHGAARLQQDFTSADEMKKLGLWLIENADRIGRASIPE